MEEKKEKKIRRVNINLTNSMLEKVKEYATRTGVSMTSAISLLISRGLSVEEFLYENPYPMLSLNEDIKHIVLDEPIDK